MTAAADRPILVIGGAGFVGSNLAHHLGRRGLRVRILDDLSRPGVEQNLAWLRSELADRAEFRIADVRDRASVREAVADVDAVFHLAAQVAVTTSLVDPVADFEINARGTLEVLEALRALPAPPPLIFTSTNKVYGCLPDVPMQLEGDRWRPADQHMHRHGIDERRPLELRTPYGCSKGSADQYVLDYAHSYGLPALVFRMSCIYGPRQFGTEDQGWIAHFLIRALAGAPITIYGDGRQVRDVLYVDDLVEAFMLAWTHIRWLRGSAFNIGGGPSNTLSLIELLDLVASLCGRRADIRFADWRAGDQRYYVSNTRAFSAATAWRPRVSPAAGVQALHGWLLQQRRIAEVVPHLEGAVHA
jgi:CDP-paratose 2-epimerase